MTYYKAWIRISDEERGKLNGLEIVSGMPVEAFLQTDKRSVMSYLTRPMMDQIRRAFRKE